MPLINCRECTAKVSSIATSCPQCGAPVAGKRATQIQGTDALVLLGSCVVGLFLGVFLSRFASEEQINLRVALGFSGLIAPPAGALYWSARKRK